MKNFKSAQELVNYVLKNGKLVDLGFEDTKCFRIEKKELTKKEADNIESLAAGSHCQTNYVSLYFDLDEMFGLTVTRGYHKNNHKDDLQFYTFQAVEYIALP